MGILTPLLRAVTWWNGPTLNTLLWSWLKGVPVGEDGAGNRFYRSRDGKRRWVMFKGDVEASRVSPEWHGWLHHTWDETPSEAPLKHKPWEKPHVENLTGTAAAYAPQGSIRKGIPAKRQDYQAWTPK